MVIFNRITAAWRVQTKDLLNMDNSGNSDGLAEREIWMEYRDKRILFRDYTGLTGKDAKRIFVLHTEGIVRRGERDLRVLVDVTSARPNKEALDVLRRESARAEPYTAKAAVIGVEGILKIVFKAAVAFNSIPIRVFESKHKALEWLASD